MSWLLGGLALSVLEPADGSAVSRFADIVIHDGSSFAVKPALQSVSDTMASAFESTFRTGQYARRQYRTSAMSSRSQSRWASRSIPARAAPTNANSTTWGAWTRARPRYPTTRLSTAGI